MGLFDPAWMSKNKDKAVKAVGKVKTQSELSEVVKKTPHEEAAYAAACRLTDQPVLAECLIEDLRSYYNDIGRVRSVMLENLTDQSLCAEVAVNSADRSIRIRASGNVKNSESLAYIARHCRDTNVLLYILKKKALNNQQVLTELAQNHEDDRVRLAAAKKLDDKEAAQAVFSNLAQRSVNWDVRIAAADKLEDKELAQRMYGLSLQSPQKYEAVRRLTDQKRLLKIANEHKDEEMRLAAADALTDKNLSQEIYANIAIKSGTGIAKTAIKRLTDRALMEKILPEIPIRVLESTGEFELNDAYLELVIKMGEQKLLFNLVMDVSSYARQPWLLKTFFEHITDKTLLAEIAARSHSADIRRMAKQKLETGLQ